MVNTANVIRIEHLQSDAWLPPFAQAITFAVWCAICVTQKFCGNCIMSKSLCFTIFDVI